MLDNTSAQLALRTRALTLVVASTGSTTLAASTVGYTRATGSFLTDGFYPGMEVTPTGFPTNARVVASAVTALLLTISGGLTAVAAAAGRTIAAGFPAQRAFENRELIPTGDRPFVEEEYVGATNRLLSYPAQGGTLEETGLYILKWYGLPKYDVPAIRKSVDALKALFAPGTTLTAGTSTLRVRSDVAPFAGQIRPAMNGLVMCPLTIPWRVETQNTIAP